MWPQMIRADRHKGQTSYTINRTVWYSYALNAFLCFVLAETSTQLYYEPI